MMAKILITGANGFVGSALGAAFEQHGDEVVRAVRVVTQANQTAVGDIHASTNWNAVLSDVSVVVHLAARVHVMHDNAEDPLAQFRAVNRDATLALARQAAAAGVRRFIFLSSIGVNGSQTTTAPFDESSQPAPHSAYAVSKLEAECQLLELCARTSMELVILRPPLVYGCAAPGNFASLLKLVSLALPLPLARARNRRSMISIENLVEIIIACAESAAAANQLFLVSDGDDVSTPQLVQALAKGMGRSAKLWALPMWTVALCAKVTGRSAAYQQLCGSLQIDSSKARNLLKWASALPAAAALERVGKEFLRRNNK